jgi:hypothetical protein
LREFAYQDLTLAERNIMREAGSAIGAGPPERLQVLVKPVVVIREF